MTNQSPKMRSSEMKVRFFIVGPTTAQAADGDTLFTVCSTTSHLSFDEIYMRDMFVDEESFGSVENAKAFCLTKGCKRVVVLQ